MLVQIIPWGDKEALAIKRRQLDVDILVTGHTHKFEHFKHEGKWMLNAGSATGAHSGQHYDVVPGFLLMDPKYSHECRIRRYDAQLRGQGLQKLGSQAS